MRGGTAGKCAVARTGWVWKSTPGIHNQVQKAFKNPLFLPHPAFALSPCFHLGKSEACLESCFLLSSLLSPNLGGTFKTKNLNQFYCYSLTKPIIPFLLFEPIPLRETRKSSKVALPFVGLMTEKNLLYFPYGMTWVSQMVLEVKNLPAREHGRHGFSPWVGKIPRGGRGNPLQHSSLENPLDREAWSAAVHRAAKSQT